MEPSHTRYCTLTVLRPHADRRPRVAARTTLTLGTTDRNDEIFWALTGHAQGTMRAKSHAAQRGTGVFFPIHFANDSIRSLHKGLQPLAPLHSQTQGTWRLQTSLATALTQARQPERNGTGALTSLLLQLERAAEHVVTTHPTGDIPSATAHGRLAAYEDARALLAWDPRHATLVVEGHTHTEHG